MAGFAITRANGYLDELTLETKFLMAQVQQAMKTSRAREWYTFPRSFPDLFGMTKVPNSPSRNT
jgi:hypothetical protein